MRILFSSTSGDGHIAPMLPLATALRALGHDVAFAMARDYAPRIEAAGLTWLAAGIGPDELNRLTFLQHDRLAELPLEQQIFVSRFALGDAPERATDLRRVLREWSPELVVSEPCDLAAPPEAAARGIRVVLHSFGRPLASSYYAAAEPFVAALWSAHALEPHTLCGVYPRQYVDICPQSLAGEELPAQTTALPLRPATPVRLAAKPEWLAALPDRPTVYITLGTIFNALPRFGPLLAGLGELDINVIATIGRDNDPADLEPLPTNAVVERFIPQDQLLPHVDVMIGHGGSGSMLGAFAHGIPQLMLPAGADQFDNAAVCQEQGLARVLQPQDTTAANVRAEVSALLADPGYRQRAAILAKEISCMPDAEAVAASLVSEQLSLEPLR